MKEQIVEDLKKKKLLELSAKIISLEEDAILVKTRFLNIAVGRLLFKPDYSFDDMGTDGETFFFNPEFIISNYKKDNYIMRCYMHMLFHLIFYHNARCSELVSNVWNLACDISTEAVILNLDITGIQIDEDILLTELISDLKKDCPKLTADSIYYYLLKDNYDKELIYKLEKLCFRDSHKLWKDTFAGKKEQWQKVSERVRTDLKFFSKGSVKNNDIITNLDEALEEHYDYGDFLRKFMVSNEEIKVNEDEFDYVYYTYGLSSYGNMPLVEPLEYKEEKKISELAIVIDTSASCAKEKVHQFIKKTYSILLSEENFFKKVNIHIIQCDEQIQSDYVVSDESSLKNYSLREKINGFGGTDFRPAFAYVNKLIKDGVFANLKGLLYFTDGYGIYPEIIPKYDVAFVFLKDKDIPKDVPSWAMKVIV